MTDEELRVRAIQELEFYKKDDTFMLADITVDLAIKALEQMPVTPQQSCEDIAKAFQFGMALGFAQKHDEIDKVMEEVKKAVTPQPKTGHWIYKQYDGYPECGNWHCSECDEIDNRTSAHCPNCGTKMIEPQEI